VKIARLSVFFLALAALALVSFSGLVGCGNETTPFPEGLEPLDEPAIDPPAGADCPEEFLIEGSRTHDYEVVLGRGYIQAPINEVWAAYQVPAVGADRRTSPSWSELPAEDPEGQYASTYMIRHQHPSFDVSWDVTWRHGIVEGTAEEPQLISIRWQKTEGSTLISLIEGSILLRPACGGAATDVQLAYHASAAASSLSDYERYMGDIYNDAVATVRGEELQSF
jgi:hypothetical protein